MKEMKFIPFVIMLICLLIVIPGCFAVDNENMTLTDGEDVDITDYYFDVNSPTDGNGSAENPYNNFTSERVIDNSRIHLASGEYNLTQNGQFLNISFYGHDAQSTILNGNGYTLNVDSNLVLHNITIKNLKISTGNLFDLMAFNTVFKDTGDSSSDRGVIYSPLTGAITLYNCSFVNNTIRDGAVILLREGSIEMYNTTFANNTAVYGAIISSDNVITDIYNSNFANNSADQFSIIYSQRSVYVYDSNFTNNTGYYGTIRIYYGTDNRLVNSYFADNFAVYGGAIYLVGCNASVNGSDFENNDAAYGGVIYSSNGVIQVYDSIFKNNSAENGGVIHSNMLISIYNSTFENNSADRGGVIYKSRGVMELYNSTFANNSAVSEGGVIYLNNAMMDIYNSTFENNSADFGGVGYIKGDTESKLFNSSFMNNSADFGGVIYINQGSLTVNGSDFKDNVASYFGGSLTSISSTLNMSNSSFYNNVAGIEGGATYSMYGNYYMYTSRFLNNSAMIGGALFVDANSNVVIKRNLFENNTAKLIGSAVYSLANKNSVIENNTYTNNDLIETSIPTVLPNENGVPIYIYNSSYTGELPSYYSLRDEGYVTPVKDQSSGGNCWAFASIGALESCILKATGITFDLSEENMKNLMAFYSDYGWNMSTNSGGYDDMAVGYLISWLGPVNESDDMYEPQSIISPILSSILHIQNIVYLTRDNYTDNDDIKKAILQFGGVSTSIRWSGAYVNYNTYSRYYDGTEAADHAVVIVGWDDNYSRNNFAKAPEGDGAWIIKNSHGLSSGDKGFWYVSYYDTKLAQPGRTDITYTFILNDTVIFDKNYQYDVPGKSDFFFNTTDTVWYKNVFNATDNEYLAAVSTFFCTDTNWDLSIYVNNNLKLVQTGFSREGYWTINLDEFIPLNIGDIFEIVFKITVDKNAGIPVSEKISFNKYFYTENISFISYDGESWVDLYDLKWTYPGHKYNSQVACIKAFTVFDEIATSTELSVVYDNAISIQAKVLNQYNRPVNAGSVTFTVDDKEYTVKVHDGIAILNLYLNPGEYTVSATFSGAGHISSKDNISINIPSQIATTVIIIANVTNQFGYSVNVGNVTFTLEGRDIVVDVVNGTATISHNFSSLGLNQISSRFNEIYYFTSSNSTSNVTVKTTINSSDATKTYSSIYSVVLLDNHGNALRNKDVTFIINFETYRVMTDENGVAGFNITLNPGTYEITVINPINNENRTQTVKVVKRIIENKALSMYYGAGKYYKVKVFDDDDNIAKGVKVTFTINNKKYTRTTDDNGYASFKISLKPAKYTITAEYKGFKVSNKITVKSTIITKDISVKKGKTIKFTAKLVNKNGKILKNKKLTFKFKGKTYKVKTNKKGKATLKITKKYKKGKYTIKTSYGKLTIKNKITIK